MILDDVDTMTDELAERLFAAGCDDGSPFSSDGVAGIGFTRTAETLEEAIRSAIGDVQQANLRVLRVELV